MPRVWRKLKEDKGVDPTWSQVLIYAAEDSRYWDKAVRRPALQFIARNKRPQPLGDDMEYEQPQQKSKRQTRREKEAVNRKKGANINLIPNQEWQNQNKGKGKGKKKGGPHPRKNDKGLYKTTKDGQAICFRWAQRGPEACSSPCPFHRVHVCQRCLQPHPNGSEACTARG